MSTSTFRVNKNIVFVLLLLSYFFSYFFRVSTSVVMPEIQAQWGLSATLVGFISSMYFYTYAIMQPLCGVLNDRFGPVRIVGTGIALTSLGSVLFGMATSPTLLIIGRLLQGIGLAPMLSGLFVYQSSYYHAALYTFLSGITLTVGNFGAVVSVEPLSAAMRTWGRETVFNMLGVITLCIAAGLFFSYLANKRNEPQRGTPKGPVFAGLGRQLREAVQLFRESANLRRLMTVWAMTVGTMLTLQGVWAVSWFSAVYAPEGNSASVAATMIGVGVMVGNMMGGKISVPGKRHRVVQCCAYFTTGMWLLTVLCFGLRLPMPVTAVMGTLLGIGTGISFVQFASAQNVLTPQGRGGAVFGIINTLNFATTIIFQWGTGAIITQVTELVGQENIAQAFLAAHGVLVCGMALVCIIASRLKPFEGDA